MSPWTRGVPPDPGSPGGATVTLWPGGTFRCPSGARMMVQGVAVDRPGADAPGYVLTPLPSRHMSDRVNSVDTCLGGVAYGRSQSRPRSHREVGFQDPRCRFTTEIQQGLNCSPFESEAVLGVVKEVYFPFLSAEATEPSPGKISLLAVAADEPAGKPVAPVKSRPSASHSIAARSTTSVSATRPSRLSPGSNPRPLPTGPQSRSLAHR